MLSKHQLMLPITMTYILKLLGTKQAFSHLPHAPLINIINNTLYMQHTYTYCIIN